MTIIKLMKVYDKIIGSAIDILITDISTGIAKIILMGLYYVLGVVCVLVYIDMRMGVLIKLGVMACVRLHCPLPVDLSLALIYRYMDSTVKSLI